MSDFKSLEQTRAKLAWEFVNSIAENFDKISSHIKKLPALILTSGLGQAVAFYLSKDDHKKIINNVAETMSKITAIEGINCGKDLLEKIRTSDHDTYILLSNEALKYATWLKRLAEAMEAKNE
ncbi:MAG: type III-B CRISPR module-associated protein Cmr5 [Desulfonauticus sp.]|nr:type III-B CRISPR module-associated protein Cmr5 [Desulfonauticus sp.]